MVQKTCHYHSGIFYIGQPLTKYQSFTCSSKFLYLFSAIFVLVYFRQLERIWSLFLLISLAPKYLQYNFEVQGVKGSLSVGLLPTVLFQYEPPANFHNICIDIGHKLCLGFEKSQF